MAEYENLFLPLSFKDYGPGAFHQGVKLGKAEHGLNVHIEYGSYDEAGTMGGPEEGPHKHDFPQLLMWLGSDPENLLELGAEVDIRLGGEGERHILTIPTAIAVPAGFIHSTGTIKKLAKPFQYMEISLAPEYGQTPAAFTNGGSETPPVPSFRTKYGSQVKRLLWLRKGPYFYGANNPEDSGGTFTSLTGKETGLELHISFESVEKAPYTFGPVPHGPHAHMFEEILLFMGADSNRLGYLGGEAVCAMGKEQEKHRFDVPMAVVCPDQFPHCPLTVTRVDKSFLFMVVSCAAAHH